jgi:cell wall-associated NlpC family hydrolase
VGTPYRQLADKLGVGVDCAMLLVRCWVDAGIYEPFDPRPYPPDWFLHKSEERYLGWVANFGPEISGPGQPGDIVVFRVGRCFAHSGIISRPGYIIHAYARVGICVETEIREISHREHKFFDMWSNLRC